MSSTDQSPGGSHKWFETTEFKVQVTSLLMKANQAPALLFSDGCLFLFIVSKGANPVPWARLKGGDILGGRQHIPKAVVLADLLEPHWPLSFGGRSDCVHGISFSCSFLGVLSCDSWLWTQRPFSRGGSAFLFVFVSSVHCVLTVETGACLPPPLSGPCMPSVTPHVLMLHRVALQAYLSNIHNCNSFHQEGT